MMMIVLGPVVCVRGTGTKRLLLSPVGGSECGSGFEGDRGKNNDGNGSGDVEVNSVGLQ